MDVQPTVDYSNKTKHELHSVITKGLICGQMNMIKLQNKTKPTKDDMKMIDSMRNTIGVYIALANKTFSETFNTLDLDGIRYHLKNRDDND
jgi:hypothetical protein